MSAFSSTMLYMDFVIAYGHCTEAHALRTALFEPGLCINCRAAAPNGNVQAHKLDLSDEDDSDDEDQADKAEEGPTPTADHAEAQEVITTDCTHNLPVYNDVGMCILKSYSLVHFELPLPALPKTRPCLSLPQQL